MAEGTQSAKPSGAEIVPTGEWTFTPEQREAIRKVYAPKATPEQFEIFMMEASRRRLMPGKQLFFRLQASNEWDAELRQKLRVEKPIHITGIDAFRLIAQRTKLYAGQKPIVWIYLVDDKKPALPDNMFRSAVPLEKVIPYAAEVAILRKDFQEPLVALARWNAYVQTYKDRDSGKQVPNSMWAKMGPEQLAKCFDIKTEVLTTNGFEPFHSVTGKILEVTNGGLRPCSARPFAQFWDGEMVVLDSDDLNFCVTPNHDMLTTAGKVEARQLYESARTKKTALIPRTLTESQTGNGLPVSDLVLVLAAAYLCDGQDKGKSEFAIEVSRPKKIAELKSLRLHRSTYERKSAGQTARGKGRTITTKKNKVGFRYEFEIIEDICSPGKKISAEAILGMSYSQARIFVDALIGFDGSKDNKSGVRRFFSCRPDHVAVFELAAVVAGYAVSPARPRTSDISTKPNFCVTISDRKDIPVFRWGRIDKTHPAGWSTKQAKSPRKHRSLEIVKNESGKVWCVTVPSGVIVVRRNGFSMLCGNCAEALGLRKAFPEDLYGLYIAEEFPDNPDDDSPQTAASGAATVPPVAALPPAPVSAAPAIEVAAKKIESASPEPAGAQPSPEAAAPVSGHADPVLNKMEGLFGGKVEVPEKSSTENVKPEPTKPDPAAGRPAGRDGCSWYVRNVLDPAGVKQGGEVLKQYVLRVTGAKNTKAITAAQFTALLGVLDGTLRMGGADAVVKLITETAKVQAA